MPNLPTRVSNQRKLVVDAVIDAIEHHGLTWITEWASGAIAQNAISGNPYRGINRLNLTFARNVYGFHDPRFCTFKQAAANGWHVKKGAKSFAIEKWKSIRIDDDTEGGEERVRVFCVGYYSVFNLEQCEGAPAWNPSLPHLDSNSITRVADGLIRSSRCPIFETDEGRACYSPIRDDIRVPDRRLFLGSDSDRSQHFVRTLAHEMTHSTMIPLRRDASDYAREELVAELGAMFVCSDLNVPASYVMGDAHFEQHAAYIKSWANGLRDKPESLFAAAAKADAASQYICERYHLMND